MVINAEMFLATLKAKEIKYMLREIDNGGAVIGIMFDSIVTSVIFEGNDDGKHVAFRTELEKCPADKITDIMVVLNSLNEKYRWEKFYISTSGNIRVEDDAIVSPETAGEECFELLIRTVSIIKEVRPVILKAMYS